MIEASNAPVGAGQFQLRLGLDAPNFFRARRGCYTQEGYLHFRGDLWIVQPRGPIKVDDRCLAQMTGHARGSPEGLFQHQAITFSPPGRERWISEGKSRWTYIQNPPSPPSVPNPPPPPPAAPGSHPGMAGGGLNPSNAEAAEALYRHQISKNASGGQRNVALLCLAAGPNPDHLADPPEMVLGRFKHHQPPVKGYSSCRWNDVHWIDKVTGGDAIVHYISSLSCTSQIRCTARGGYLEGNLSASGNRYVVERRNGRWQVTGDVMEWIS